MKAFTTLVVCIALAVFGGFVSDIKTATADNVTPAPIVLNYPNSRPDISKFNTSELGVKPQVIHDTVYKLKPYAVIKRVVERSYSPIIFVERSYSPIIFLARSNTECSPVPDSYKTDTIASEGCDRE